MKAIIEKYKLPQKDLFEHGYSRIDSLVSENKLRPSRNLQGNKHILIAPTWGDQATIESGLADKIIEQLLKDKFIVTLRPHPQTIKFHKTVIESLLKKYSRNEDFNYESNVSGQDSLHDSDLMISDWSGAAIEYAYALKKPVIFVDTPMKVNNPNYKEIDIKPFELSIREEIGTVLTCENIVNLKNIWH